MAVLFVSLSLPIFALLNVRCEPVRQQSQDGVLKSEGTIITDHFLSTTTRFFLSVLENISTNTELTHLPLIIIVRH